MLLVNLFQALILSTVVLYCLEMAHKESPFFDGVCFYCGITWFICAWFCGICVCSSSGANFKFLSWVNEIGF